MKTLLFFAALTLIWSCSLFTGTGPGGGGSGGDNNTPTHAGIQIKLTNNQALTSQTSRAAIGQSTSSGLTSYKVAISRIELVGDATITGTGYSNAQQVLTLYDNTATIDDTGAMDTTNPAFVDLLDPTSSAGFTPSYTLTAADLGTYRYLFITYAPYVQMQGSVDLSDSTTLYTKAGGTFVQNASMNNPAPSSGVGWYTDNSSADFTTAPAELEAVKLQGGGSIQKFATPLEITQADIDGAVQLNLALVFNPDAAVTASRKAPNGPSDFMISGTIWDADLNSFSVAIPNLGALVTTADQTVVQETYTSIIHETKTNGDDRTSSGGLAWNSEWFKERIEIYSLQSDPNTILSVQVSYLVDPNSVTSPSSSDPVTPSLPFPPMYFSIDSQNRLSFEDYANDALVTNLTRLTNVGDTGTADFSFFSSMNPDPTQSDPLFPMALHTLAGNSYTLDAVRILTN